MQIDFNAKFDFSSIMNLLPSGNNNLGGLGSLTNGMSFSDVMKLMKLLKELNDLKGEITAIPQDVLTALNKTSELLLAHGFNITQLMQHEVAGGRYWYSY